LATLGETLYAARSAREETLEDVARVLRIRPAILQALENGDIAALPSGAVIKGFVRTYTKYLGLDDDQAVRLFEEEAGSHAGRSTLSFPEAVEPARLPGAGTVIIGGLIVIFAVISWVAYVNRDALGIDRVSELPDRLMKLISGDQDDTAAPAEPVSPEPNAPPGDSSRATGGSVEPATPRSSGTAILSGRDSRTASMAEVDVVRPLAPVSQSNLPARPTPTGPVILAVLPPLTGDTMASEAEEQVRQTLSSAVDETLLPPTSDSASSPAPETTADGGVPIPEETALPETGVENWRFAGDGQIFGDVDGAPRVIVRALGDSWVQVRNVSGQTVFSRIMRKGDTYRVPPAPGLTMIAGSVGDLEFWVDGAALSPLGDSGLVRRDIPLDAERLTQLGPG